MKFLLAPLVSVLILIFPNLGYGEKRIYVRHHCSDGIDNDHDGKIDYPADRGCTSRNDDSEGTVITPPRAVGNISTGVNVSLHGARIFPATDAWNQDVSGAPIDPNSNKLISNIGNDVHLHPDWGTYWEGKQIGFSYVVVSGNQQKYPMSFYYPNESDVGPYPVPLNAPIEQGGSDRHVIAIDKDNWKLYELFDATPQKNSWKAGSGAVFNLATNTHRPAGWTSADAAGMPIFPGLVRWDEVMEQGVINHALRFTVPLSRKAYVAPASHYASYDKNPNLPPMGMRVRLKASYDISSFPKPIKVVLTALKKYGMFVADNGAAWFIPGIYDPRWNDSELGSIKNVPGSAFEVVKMGPVTVGN